MCLVAWFRFRLLALFAIFCLKYFGDDDGDENSSDHAVVLCVSASASCFSAGMMRVYFEIDYFVYCLLF